MRDNDERQRRGARHRRGHGEEAERYGHLPAGAHPDRWRPKLEFKMDEISEALGRPMTPHLFEISTSTHYGRMVMVDDNTVVCFGNMDEALAYIEH